MLNQPESLSGQYGCNLLQRIDIKSKVSTKREIREKGISNNSVDFRRNSRLKLKTQQNTVVSQSLQ